MADESPIMHRRKTDIIIQADPSELTTAQLIREIESTKAQMGRQFDSVNRLMAEKLNGVEKIFDEQRRAMLTAEQEREKSAAALRDYLVSIIEGDRRAAGVAEQEREKAAQALRAAIGVAEQEREKAAHALRIELARAITDGDSNLRDHVKHQVVQIQAALNSAEALELQRIESLRREMTLIFEASEEAIGKADVATEKRFASVNEFRKTLTDQAGNFVNKDVAASQQAAVEERIRRLENWQATLNGITVNQQKNQPWAIWAVGAAVTLLISLIVIGIGAFT